MVAGNEKSIVQRADDLSVELLVSNELRALRLSARASNTALPCTSESRFPTPYFPRNSIQFPGCISFAVPVNCKKHRKEIVGRVTRA